MKKRRVIFLAEVESTESIKDLRDNLRFGLSFQGEDVFTKVIQIQTNVVQKRTISKRSGKR
jgi:hypothetical protein